MIEYDYAPDSWVVLKVNDDTPFYKLLCGWSGGYLDGDAWRINSGITWIKSDQDHFYFGGHSGSCYRCHKNTYGLQNITAQVFDQLEQKHGSRMELMPAHTQWETLVHQSTKRS